LHGGERIASCFVGDKKLPAPLRMARFEGGAETADFFALGYVPDVE
jgi:hypothetical protein